MKALKTICLFFAVIFGLTAVSCVYNLFNPGGPNSTGSLLLCGILMIALTVLCLLGAKKTGAKAQETGEGVIIKTKIVDAYGKTSATSAVTRGAVGNMVAGPVGAVVGASTAKTNRSTTFLIFYKNGKKATRTVQNNSLEYQKYIKYLDE